MKSILLSVLSLFISLVRLAVLLCTLLFAIHIVYHYIDNAGKYSTLTVLNNYGEKLGQPLIAQIKEIVPYSYQGTDYSTHILILCMLVVAYILASMKDKVNQWREKEKYFEWRQQVSSKVSKEELAQMDNTFESLTKAQSGFGKSTDRKKLLQEFVSLKSKLDSMGQQLAFLAIDVVDSTGMKKDEDKHLITYDFDRYNEIVLECLAKHGVVKYAMTPDGIMSCFRTVDDAVGAAIDLLDKLKIFNKEEKKIKRDFVIRAGINSGFIYLDEETPLEQISDRAIDIAGHMQKHAKPDTINIAATAIEPLKNRGGFVETVDVIDEQRVFSWVAKE